MKKSVRTKDRPLNFVLLRGLFRESRHWEEFPAQLTQHFGGNVISLNLPGTGSLYHLPTPIELNELVVYLHHQFLREQNGDEEGPWVLLGVSMGGMIGLKWAENFPEDFAGVVAINSSCGSSSIRARLKPQTQLAIAKLMWHEVKEKIASYRSEHYRQPKLEKIKERESIILRLTSHRSEAEVEERAQEFAEFAQQNPISLANFCRQLFLSSRFRPNTIQIPVLILASAKDQICDFTCSEELARLYLAFFQLHPSAGHDLPIDDPAWVMQQLSDWQQHWGPSVFTSANEKVKEKVKAKEKENFETLHSSEE
jgi:pimeloyl-ACP methyl ester carboxylesterase